MVIIFILIIVHTFFLQQSICLGVKLSELPDNGQKLLAQIENISRLIRESNMKISTKSSQLSALNKSGKKCNVLVLIGQNQQTDRYAQRRLAD